MLPNSTETKIAATANARALRQFFDMRASEAADHKIEILAVALLRAIQSATPTNFGDYQIARTPKGREVAMTPCRKVRP